MLSLLPLLFDLFLQRGLCGLDIFATESLPQFVFHLNGLHHGHEFFLLAEFVVTHAIQGGTDTPIGVLYGFLFLIVFEDAVSELWHLQIVLQGKLLVIVRFELFGQLLVIGDLLWAYEEALLVLLEGELVVEFGLLRSLLVLPVPLLMLLLYQSLSQCSSHLYLPLAFVVPVIMCAFHVQPHYLLFHVEICLVLILSPLITLLDLPLLLLLYQEFLNS